MTNHLPDDKVTEIRAYAKRGWSSWATSVASGVSHDAVKRHYREYEKVLGYVLMCPCGKRIRHVGTCKPRIDQLQEAESLRPLPEGWKHMESEAEARAEDRTEPLVHEIKPPPIEPLDPPPPIPRVRSEMVRSKCPKGYCEMHLDHVVKAGSYEIEYWKCSCNEERTERRVAHKLGEAV